MSAIRFDANTLTVLLSDSGTAGANSLTSLAAGAAAITTSPGIDNTPGSSRQSDFWLDLELTLFFAVAPTAGKTIDVYLLPSYDGTHYDDGSTTGPIAPAGHYVGSVAVRNVTTVQRLALRGIALPPTKCNVLVVNSTDQALAAQSTGSQVAALTFRPQSP